MILFEQLPYHLLIGISAVYLLLIVATITIRILRHLRPRQDYNELAARINSWWIMVIIFTLAILFSRTLTLVFLGFVSFLALKEYLSMIPTRRADRRVLFWSYLCIPIQYYWIYSGWYGMFIIFIPVYMFLLIPVRMLLVGQTFGFLKAIGTLHWGRLLTRVINIFFLPILPNRQTVFR